MPAPATSSTTAGTPILFAQPAAEQAGSPVALMVTVGLLVAACIALWFVRQRGYLRRWIGVQPAPRAGVKVVQRLRLGMHSHAYVLEDGGDRWMVVEGRQGIHLTPLRPASEGEGA